ncbi:plasmid partitioning protein RepB C-terminal domain-containing protein [Phenylobacterium sp. 58.2.17]|uniref:plasmid partitioning protein RepB C-terminal domain-containing protein n=1 Tax=Phenylobacterium sp. 58.2.17 TaxID=2969306 RepID=UPI002263C1F9|nr:plasmid partitioning protein RepB C-terminal domain-containing protein [Phenylobacterium sp. 58.2.17]MCX7584923.1 ParB N-terminal domain-containing protein [Phenylobacterium sp. 58.2.17]
MSDSGPTLGVRLGFESQGVRLQISAIAPMKSLRPSVKLSAKYRQILTSVQAVGLVEPPVVIPDQLDKQRYFLLDGHLRIEALKDLGHTEVVCLVATDDETFTYNKRVNRLPAPQEHRMMVRAIERGVAPERLAEALGFNVQSVQRRVRLMDGIGEETAELLKDTVCPLSVFDVLRKMTPLRQLETAQMMIGHNNFGKPFAMAMLAATPEAQLAKPRRRGKPAANPVTREQVARLERELASLQMQIKSVEETYGLDNLHLTVAKSYLTKLLSNVRVVRWLAQQRPEYLTEFQAIAELTSLPVETSAAAE